MIQLKTEAEVELMRAAGLVVGRTLERLRGAAVPGVTTAELDELAVTVGVGEVAPEHAELLRVCEEALWRAFAAARLGGRVTDLGHAIESYVATQGEYGIVEEYTGHGIGTEMHQMPHVPNYGRPGRGPRLEPGLVLAVEPMLNLGTRHTRQLDDGWTVVTADGAWSAHFEHTFTLTASGPWVLTAVDGGAARLAALGATAATG
jgi:methionyl aminopeptidase